MYYTDNMIVRISYTLVISISILLGSACSLINKGAAYLIASNDSPGSAFIINRTGNDVLIYMTNHRGFLLKNGCDDAISLIPENYKGENIYIEECTESAFLERRCVGGITKKFTNVSDMIRVLNDYQREKKSSAAYLLDENYNLILIPYNEKPKYNLTEGFIVTCKE
ncbi:hypothetical protein [Desulfovibrio fairfieldensis]|uniref:hypothetical protein n=1 Tax=Desulfovibrio fairfieldensis TaxID=44742 RepID=UPI0012372624|nr:hypothetical protein [Desulfovibrio fairfieldensis]